MYIFGDTHGNWKIFNQNLVKIKNSNVIVAGDFGYWPNLSQCNLQNIDTHGCKIYFCPGNHEDWSAILKLETSTDERIIPILPNIYYCSFGSVINLEGYNIMFCGGADSVDKNYRTEGVDWFRDEIITEGDLHFLPNRHDIDIVISHTGPREIIEKLNQYGRCVTDKSCDRLSWIWNYYKPLLWVYAHFHSFGNIRYDNTTFYQLDRETAKKFHILKVSSNFRCNVI